MLRHSQIWGWQFCNWFIVSRGPLLVLLTLPAFEAGALTPEEITAKGRPATVFIAVEAESANGAPLRASGTGFLIHSAGYVLTSKHLIPQNTKDAPRIRGSQQSRYGHMEEMELIAPDPHFDFALLKFSNTSIARPSVAIGNPWALRVAAPLQSLGFPLNVEFTSKTGSLVGTGGPGGSWVTDIALNPGDSGGPVFSSEGNVVAMVVSALPQAEGIKFVLPITFSSYLLKLVGLEKLASFSQGDTVFRYAVSNTREATNSLTPSSEKYEFEVLAKPGFRIIAAELSRRSDARLSDVAIKISESGDRALLQYRLTSGPAYDRYRGWLHGEVVTQQVPR